MVRATLVDKQCPCGDSRPRLFGRAKLDSRDLTHRTTLSAMSARV